ncbi:hypothetical protein JL721_2808 [Aureococcus anophagefferens]|nr:hypothetical protein JL721_2808 [Aureococcus anophagefferens]
MPKAENGGIADEHARLVAAAHMADKEARHAAYSSATGGHRAQLPEGTHVKATKVGGARNRPRPGPEPGPAPAPRRRRRRAAPPPLRPPPPLAAPPETRRRRPRKRKDALAMVGI